MERLFDVASAAVNGCVSGRSACLDPRLDSTAYGALSELWLQRELLARGHKLAVPLVDDDGVDLVVDYRLTVQVKSRRVQQLETRPGYVYDAVVFKAPGRADVLALTAADRWWFIPRSEVPNRSGFSLLLDATRGRAARFQEYEDAWWVFDG